MARKYIRNQQEKQCFQKQTLPARAIGRSRFGHFSLCIFIFRAAHSVSLVHEEEEEDFDLDLIKLDKVLTALFFYLSPKVQDERLFAKNIASIANAVQVTV